MDPKLFWAWLPLVLFVVYTLELYLGATPLGSAASTTIIGIAFAIVGPIALRDARIGQ